MKLLRAFLLIIAIALGAQTAWAGEMPYGINSPAPDIGTELITLLSLLF
jgi:hypothetical protein